MKYFETLYSLFFSGLLLFMLGKYFFKDAYVELTKRIRLSFKGKRTEGTITSVFISKDSDGTFSHGMVVRFDDDYGMERQFRPDVRFDTSPVVGKKVKVIFLPTNPEVAELYSFFLLFPPVLALATVIIAGAGIIHGLIKQFS